MNTAMRIIPRLDVKGPHVVKGVHMEGLKVVGTPADLAERYYKAGADELLYMDIVASLYGRNIDLEIVRSVADRIFIPLAVGGGVRTLSHIEQILYAGADKVVINTHATKQPTFLREAARRFGAQCVVLSVEAKRQPDGTYEAYTDGGRERSGRLVSDWIEEALSLGIGEIILSSIDSDGTRRGFDNELLHALPHMIPVPLVLHGGFDTVGSLVATARVSRCDAFALATMLHIDNVPVEAVKLGLQEAGIIVRL